MALLTFVLVLSLTLSNVKTCKQPADSSPSPTTTPAVLTQPPTTTRPGCFPQMITFLDNTGSSSDPPVNGTVIFVNMYANMHLKCFNGRIEYTVDLSANTDPASTVLVKSPARLFCLNGELWFFGSTGNMTITKFDCNTEEPNTIDLRPDI